MQAAGAIIQPQIGYSLSFLPTSHALIILRSSFVDSRNLINLVNIPHVWEWISLLNDGCLR